MIPIALIIVLGFLAATDFVAGKLLTAVFEAFTALFLLLALLTGCAQ